jgi:putative salt-induced outer membrane protein
VKLTTLASLAILALAPAAASSQTPECPCPVPPATPPQWFGKAELSFLSTSGNTDTTSLGGSLELNYKPAPWLFTLKGAYLRAATNGVTTAESFTGSLRGARDLTPRLDVYANTGYLRNRFSGIENLFGFDGGAGYKFLNSPVLFLRLEAGVGWAHEEDLLLPPPAESITTTRSYATVKSALAFKWQFTKVAAFTNDFTFLDDLDDTANWFITDKAAITAQMSSLFALQASWTLLYRNEPTSAAFGHTDTATAVSLVAKF